MNYRVRAFRPVKKWTSVFFTNKLLRRKLKCLLCFRSRVAFRLSFSENIYIQYRVIDQVCNIYFFSLLDREVSVIHFNLLINQFPACTLFRVNHCFGELLQPASAYVGMGSFVNFIRGGVFVIGDSGWSNPVSLRISIRLSPPADG